MSFSALEAFICFAYTGKMQITPWNVQALLIGASFLQVSNVKEVCCKYIEERLTPDTALLAKSFAQSLLCTSLVKACDVFINENFVAVSRTGSFIKLPGHVLLEMLDSDDLFVDSEELIFLAIVRWMEAGWSQTPINASSKPSISLETLVMSESSKSFPGQDSIPLSQDFVKKNLHISQGLNTYRSGSQPSLLINQLCSYLPDAGADLVCPTDGALSLSWSVSSNLQSHLKPSKEELRTSDSPLMVNPRYSILPDLLKRVRLPLLSAKFLTEVVSKYEPIRTEIKCR
ncbi:unnamed protein product [Protopolystoma xenopodis]|uniref:BACK domain-containing protein n=1 Tax=Protopolystoma xenopodis TaxID=117903 RepID=A0A448XIY4_9PLAT|nr:unnamed protein product [Protopolystoma xenopodis]